MSEEIIQYREHTVDAKHLTAFIYVLYFIGLFSFGITAIVAIILNYVKRKDVEGTFCASHFTWQIHTFWWACLFFAISFVLKIILVGFVTAAIAWIWVLYRLIKGSLYLYENRPVK